MTCLTVCLSVNSYEQALQALADSEARRETSDKEMKLVSQNSLTGEITQNPSS